MLRVACEAKSEEAEHCGDYLEHREGQSPRNVTGPRYGLQPTRVLSKLCMVCGTFSDTIKGSPKLQRALTGEADATLDYYPGAQPSLPMKWLCQRALGVREKRNEPRTHLHIQNSQTSNVRDALKHFMSDYRIQRSEASWRRVRIYKQPTTAVFHINVEFRRPRLYGGVRGYVEEIDLSTCITLGEFLDKLPGILNRTGARHIARMHALGFM